MNEVNQLSAPEGAMVEASNVFIRRDNVIEPRRGFKLYGTPFGTSSDRAKQLMEYKNRIIRHYDSTLQYDTTVLNDAGESIFATFFGSYSEVESGLRIKSIEANSNLYFTTSDGIKKISASNANQFVTTAGYITNAGGIKALDITTRLNVIYGDDTGFLPVDSVVAYRVVWGIKDVNGNLILGTPSSPSIVYNSEQVMIVRDYMQLLYQLDQLDTAGSRIDDGNYVDTLKLPDNASASQIRTNLLLLSEKLDLEQGTLFGPSDIVDCTFAAGVATIKLNNSVAVFGRLKIGDTMFLKQFNINPQTVINGPQIVTNVTNDGANSFIQFETPLTGTVVVTTASIESGEFRGIPVPDEPSTPATHNEVQSAQDYLSNIISELQSERNLLLVGKNTGVNTQNPLEITTAAVTGTTTLTVNFDVSVANTDANNEFLVGDLIDLTGLWDAAGAEDISGPQTVASVDVAGAFITVTLATPVTNGAVTIDSGSEVDQITRFTNELQIQFINDLTITTTATVIITITVPTDATVNSFFQIYRGSITTATGTDVLQDLIPNDEMKLVYENYPTAAEISARQIVVQDIVPESFVQGATNLYTNEISGEGILQSNDLPPKAHDINVFKNYTWYANTSTRQRLNITLLGVTKIIEDFNNSLDPQIMITNGIVTNTYYFILGEQEVTDITTTAGAALAAAGPGDYFTLNGGANINEFYVWYQIGTSTDPAVPGKVGIEVFASAGDTATQIAQKTRDRLNTFVDSFQATSLANVLTVTNTQQGPADDATAGTTAFGIVVTTQGAGEDAAAHQVLLSNNVSPSIAVTETSQSLVRVINENTTEIVNAFYISGINDTPGNIFFESKSLIDPIFYILTNQNGTGTSFNPTLAPSVIGITNTAANPTIVTATAHGMVDGDQVVIIDSNSTPPINGLYTISQVTANTFAIPVNVTIAGTSGSIQQASVAESSDNEVKVNRLYYSKLQQPEAVPLLNYLDVGSENKAILRIFPLRDSLFVFKEDGLYRVSGETPPWNLALFDQTVKLIASDSLGLANNLIYLWSKEGIITVSEAGKQLISRPIDVLILPISSSGLYPNFRTATWGVGYESDNAYYVYTVTKIEDVVATICFRYSNLTGTWTTYDKTNTCGIIKYSDDKLYMGAGDVNSIEIERKEFAREDYADRQYVKTLIAGNYFQSGRQMKFNNIDHVAIGDVIVQNQTVSIYTYNQLLKKLDIDPQLNDDDYFTTLEAVGGNNMRTKLEELAEKLDADIGLSNIDTFVPADVNTGTDTITITAHGFVNNQPVKFSSTGTLPSPLNSTDFFYIVGATANTFQLSTTEGGAVLNITTTGTGIHTIQHSEYQALIISRISYPISSNSAASPTVITSTNHGLQNGRIVTIAAVSGSMPNINGTFVVTRLTANTFSIPVNVLTPGTGGAFTTLIQNFDDLEACYNLIIAGLNGDPGAGFANYDPITELTPLEAIIIDFNRSTGLVTLTPSLDFIQGPLILYKHIESTFTYSSLTLGDPVGYKQIREAEMYFENKTFTNAVMSFSTDLLPEFIDVPFNGLGNGIFGNNDEFGLDFFGGNSHSAPFRTYIPRQCQRCRSLDVKFTHAVAREKYSIFGVGVSARVGISGRAYR